MGRGKVRDAAEQRRDLGLFLRPRDSRGPGIPVRRGGDVIAGCLFLGLFRTAAYGAALALHAVTVFVSWRELLDPWGTDVNHLFIASVPVLGALIALFLLRHWDRGILEAGKPSASGAPPM